MDRKKLSEILRNGDRERLDQAWSEAKAADDFAPLPSGQYIVRIVGGSATTAKSGTPGYKLTFKVLEGKFVGRLFWLDIWLTPAAMPMAKRDLMKVGVTSLAQLDRPLPPGIRCKVDLALRRDEGTEYNRVRSFEVLGIDPPQVDPFAPENKVSSAAVAEQFPFGANVDPSGPYRDERR
jgi:hypothetical protein